MIARSSFATARNADVNFGDSVQLKGQQREKIASISLEASDAFTIYATARIDAPPALLPFVVAAIDIEWGHGGASVRESHTIARRLRVPVSGSAVLVEGRLVDARTGKPPPETVKADVAAVIAPGADNEGTLNARTVVQQGSSGVVSNTAERVLTVSGYNALGTGRWLMLFDAVAVPADGATPRMAAPASAGFERIWLHPAAPRDFFHGVAWALSSTPLTLTADAGAQAHLEVELWR